MTNTLQEDIENILGGSIAMAAEYDNPDKIIQQLIQLITQSNNEARIRELNKTIAFFNDEGRESKDVLEAYRKARIKELSAERKDTP